MYKKDPIIPCLCLTCGVRNDFTHPAGFCQNGHDDWLEYQDIEEMNQWFYRALNLTGLTPEELQKQFMDPENKRINIKPIEE